MTLDQADGWNNLPTGQGTSEDKGCTGTIPGPGKIQTKAASPLQWHEVPSDIIVSFGIDPS
jgi:hypothetical protein